MRVDLFDFDLPPERIALRPARPRDAARMLVVRADGDFEDRGVRDLPRLLRAGDVLDLLPPTTDEPASAVVTTAVGDALVERYGAADTAEFRLAVGSAVEVADALVARAFARSSAGDDALLAEARRSVSAVLADRL